MSDEYWATFSIYDHRQSALYRRALILFDRVVIPIPTSEVGDLKQKEIDALYSDVIYLEEHGAGVRFDWNPKEFQEWQKKTIEHEACDREALAKILVNDPPYATRLQLKQETEKQVSELRPKDVDSITAIPVYETTEKYDAVIRELQTQEYKTIEIVMKKMPVPSEDVSLEDIIRLRNNEQFKESLYQLRKWQMTTVRELLEDKDGRLARLAAKDFNRWIKKYEEAISDANFKKIETGIISVLSVGAALAVGATPLIASIAGLAQPLFSFKEIIKPSWKEVSEKEYAPAGVIYAAKKL